MARFGFRGRWAWSAIAALLTLLFYYRGTAHKSRIRVRVNHQISVALRDSNTRTDSDAGRFLPWCSPEECSSGRWLPRQPPFRSMVEFREAYANRRDHVWKGCRAPPNATRSSSDSANVDEDRLMNVMSWTWTPYIGKMKQWDAEEFVIRLLKSPGGLILIGGTTISPTT
jgi:hypothetical protein